MIRTLIIPCLTLEINPVFEYDNDICTINCVKAISGMNLSDIDEIYFIILKEMDDYYHLADKISVEVKRTIDCENIKYKIITLDGMTSSPAETVYKALEIIGNINNRSLFIKDADNTFKIEYMPNDNALITASLEELTLVDTMHKSYIKLDEQGFVTNCIEKRVVSDKFIAGGYIFRDASLFIKAYDALNRISNKFYISDIIFWLILNKNEKFMPVKAMDFKDFNFK